MKRLLGLTTLLLLLALPAAATQCETFTNHSGFVPDGWTATFTENDVDYGPFVGPTFVDPGTAYEGNRSWDRAVKCRTVENTTTTTEQVSSTTSTTDPTTTSTSEFPTTTATESTPPTTSVPPLSTTLPALSSTVPTPSTTGPSSPDQVILDTLPYTGSDPVWLIVGALSLLAGVGVLSVTRREDG